MDSVPIYERGIDSRNGRFAEMSILTGPVPSACYVDVSQSPCIVSWRRTTRTETLAPAMLSVVGRFDGVVSCVPWLSGAKG